MDGHGLLAVLRRVLWCIGGLVLVAVGLGLLATGLSITQTFGSSGSVSTDSARIEGPGKALVTDGLSVAGGSPLQQQIGTLTLSARSEDGKPLFIGLAREDDVFVYLDGVPYDVVSNLTASSATVRSVPGSAPVRPPESQTFWVRQASGDQPSIDWPSDADGKGYRLVVMNSDGSAGVVSVIRLGFTSQSLPGLGLGASVIGAVLLVPAIWMLYRAFRRRRAPAAAPAPVVAAPPTGAPLVASPPVEPPAAEPVVVAAPAAETPPAESQAAEPVVVAAPAVDTPAAEPPAAESAAVAAPAAEIPAAEPPAAEPAAVAAPAAETPAAEPPAADAVPAVDTAQNPQAPAAD